MAAPQTQGQGDKSCGMQKWAWRGPAKRLWQKDGAGVARCRFGSGQARALVFLCGRSGGAAGQATKVRAAHGAAAHTSGWWLHFVEPRHVSRMPNPAGGAASNKSGRRSAEAPP